MTIEVTEVTTRGFTVTLTEAEAEVLKGIMGGLYYPLPAAAEDFFDHLEEFNVESKGDLVVNGEEVRWKENDD